MPYTKFYRASLFACLDYEIKSKPKIYKNLKLQYEKLLCQFKSVVTWLDFKVLTFKITRQNGFKISKVNETHTEKLLTLDANIDNQNEADKVFFLTFLTE